MCSNPSTLKTLLLVYIDTLRSVKEENQLVLQSDRDKELSKKMAEKKFNIRARLANYEETADVLGECLKILKGSVALIDEVDQVMHALKSELNFPLGDKEELNLGALRWRLPIFLLNAILPGKGSSPASIPCEIKYREELARKVEKGLRDSESAFTSLPHLVLLRKDFYDLEVLPALCRLAALWIVNEQITLTSDRDEKEILSSVDCIAAYLYLPGKLSLDSKRGFESGSVSKNPSLLKEVNAKLPWKTNVVFGQMNLARQWCRTVLPHCISKRHRVEYGLIYPSDIVRWQRLKGEKSDLKTDEDPLDVYKAPAGRRFLAVPFTGKDVPSSAAEFSR